MEHLGSLDFEFKGKTVLDIGAGVGHLAQFFVERGARVTCAEAREANIARGRELYPSLEFHQAEVEAEPLSRFGVFDVVFSYGLLYHLENPVRGLRNIASACRDLLLLETLVADHEQPISFLIDEPKDNVNQAVGGFGCRPSPSFVTLALARLDFPWIYAPVEPPAYRDFGFEWRNNVDVWRDGHNLRCIFVASRTELSNPKLSLLHSAPERD